MFCNKLTSIIIPKEVMSIGSQAFGGCDKLTIYVETSSQPSGWSFQWNAGLPVVWGYTS